MLKTDRARAAFQVRAVSWKIHLGNHCPAAGIQSEERSIITINGAGK